MAQEYVSLKAYDLVASSKRELERTRRYGVFVRKLFCSVCFWSVCCCFVDVSGIITIFVSSVFRRKAERNRNRGRIIDVD